MHGLQGKERRKGVQFSSLFHILSHGCLMYDYEHEQYLLIPKIPSDQIWVAGYFGSLRHAHILLFSAQSFCVIPYHHKLQEKLSLIQNRIVSKKLWHLFSRNFKLRLYFN
jgi:hypothetical protein